MESWQTDFMLQPARTLHSLGPNVALPLEYTCTTKSLSALLFWGVSRQFSRKASLRAHCGRVLIDVVQSLVQRVPDMKVRVPCFFAQAGSTVGTDGSFWILEVNGGHVAMRDVWNCIPDEERSGEIETNYCGNACVISSSRRGATAGLDRVIDRRPGGVPQRG